VLVTVSVTKLALLSGDDRDVVAMKLKRRLCDAFLCETIFSKMNNWHFQHARRDCSGLRSCDRTVSWLFPLGSYNAPFAEEMSSAWAKNERQHPVIRLLVDGHTPFCSQADACTTP
jgi:hypothetical protein